MQRKYFDALGVEVRPKALASENGYQLLTAVF
eukprot:SAG31_NODE_23075_length_512_cov_0.622276_2_plen_31_part_01